MTDVQTPPDSPFRPLEQPANLTSTLVARLTEEIVSGRLAPGVRLPTEQEMMTSFGVSRTVIREAVAALKADGLVVTRQGSGAFVAAQNRRPFRIEPSQLETVRDVLHLMELRMSVEIEAAGLAAERRLHEDLVEIDRRLDDIDRAIDAGEQAINEDFAFHRAIAGATHNPYHLKFLEFLGDRTIPRQGVLFSPLASDRYARAYLGSIQNEHRMIAAAIKAQDADRARAMARQHFVNSQDRYRRIAEEVEAREQE